MSFAPLPAPAEITTQSLLQASQGGQDALRTLLRGPENQPLSRQEQLTRVREATRLLPQLQLTVQQRQLAITVTRQILQQLLDDVTRESRNQVGERLQQLQKEQTEIVAARRAAILQEARQNPLAATQLMQPEPTSVLGRFWQWFRDAPTALQAGVIAGGAIAIVGIRRLWKKIHWAIRTALIAVGGYLGVLWLLRNLGFGRGRGRGPGPGGRPNPGAPNTPSQPPATPPAQPPTQNGPSESIEASRHERWYVESHAGGIYNNDSRLFLLTRSLPVNPTTNDLELLTLEEVVARLRKRNEELRAQGRPGIEVQISFGPWSLATQHTAIQALRGAITTMEVPSIMSEFGLPSFGEETSADAAWLKVHRATSAALDRFQQTPSRQSYEQARATIQAEITYLQNDDQDRFHQRTTIPYLRRYLILLERSARVRGIQ